MLFLGLRILVACVILAVFLALFWYSVWHLFLKRYRIFRELFGVPGADTPPRSRSPVAEEKTRRDRFKTDDRRKAKLKAK
ncbi:MAG: hypothetical protein MHM6MM_007414 [Cercozoa sp. M6MM]